MGIDTSIYNNLLRAPKSVGEYDAEAMAGQQNKLALQAAQMQLADRQRGIADEQQLRGVVSKFGADKGANFNALMGAGRLKEAQAYEKTNADSAKSQREAEKAEIEGHFKKFELAGQIIGGVKDQASWDLARQQTAQVFGPEAAAQLPAQYDPALVEKKRIQAMTVKDQLTQVWKEKEFDLDVQKFGETVRNNKEQTATTQRGQNMTAKSAAVGHGLTAQRLKFDKEQTVGTGPDASEAMVDAIGLGKMSPPSGYALRNPKMLQMMERVAQKYPDFDATEYDGKKRAMRDFTTGKQGDSIRSFAVASDHLTQLDGLVDALQNGNIPLVNKYANVIAQNTGSVAPTNFEAAKGIVAKEVLKSIVAGGGGVEERQELSHLLSTAKTGPQLKGVIKTYLHLMEAQKDGLERQYEVSTGRKDAKTRFDYTKKAGAPETKAGPAVGTVEGGYRFKGGNPSDKANWVKQ